MNDKNIWNSVLDTIQKDLLSIRLSINPQSQQQQQQQTSPSSSSSVEIERERESSSVSSSSVGDHDDQMIIERIPSPSSSSTLSKHFLIQSKEKIFELWRENCENSSGEFFIEILFCILTATCTILNFQDFSTLIIEIINESLNQLSNCKNIKFTNDHLLIKKLLPSVFSQLWNNYNRLFPSTMNYKIIELLEKLLSIIHQLNLTLKNEFFEDHIFRIERNLIETPHPYIENYDDEIEKYYPICFPGADFIILRFSSESVIGGGDEIQFYSSMNDRSNQIDFCFDGKICSSFDLNRHKTISFSRDSFIMYFYGYDCNLFGFKVEITAYFSKTEIPKNFSFTVDLERTIGLLCGHMISTIIHQSDISSKKIPGGVPLSYFHEKDGLFRSGLQLDHPNEKLAFDNIDFINQIINQSNETVIKLIQILKNLCSTAILGSTDNHPKLLEMEILVFTSMLHHCGLMNVARNCSKILISQSIEHLDESDLSSLVFLWNQSSYIREWAFKQHNDSSKSYDDLYSHIKERISFLNHSLVPVNLPLIKQQQPHPQPQQPQPQNVIIHQQQQQNILSKRRRSSLRRSSSMIIDDNNNNNNKLIILNDFSISPKKKKSNSIEKTQSFQISSNPNHDHDQDMDISSQNDDNNNKENEDFHQFIEKLNSLQNRQTIASSPAAQYINICTSIISWAQSSTPSISSICNYLSDKTSRCLTRTIGYRYLLDLLKSPSISEIIGYCTSKLTIPRNPLLNIKCANLLKREKLIQNYYEIIDYILPSKIEDLSNLQIETLYLCRFNITSLRDFHLIKEKRLLHRISEIILNLAFNENKHIHDDEKQQQQQQQDEKQQTPSFDNLKYLVYLFSVTVAQCIQYCSKIHLSSRDEIDGIVFIEIIEILSNLLLQIVHLKNIKSKWIENEFIKLIYGIRQYIIIFPNNNKSTQNLFIKALLNLLEITTSNDYQIQIIQILFYQLQSIKSSRFSNILKENNNNNNNNQSNDSSINWLKDLFKIVGIYVIDYHFYNIQFPNFTLSNDNDNNDHNLISNVSIGKKRNRNDSATISSSKKQKLDENSSIVLKNQSNLINNLKDEFYLSKKRGVIREIIWMLQKLSKDYKWEDVFNQLIDEIFTNNKNDKNDKLFVGCLGIFGGIYDEILTDDEIVACSSYDIKIQFNCIVKSFVRDYYFVNVSSALPIQCNYVKLLHSPNNLLLNDKNSFTMVNKIFIKNIFQFLLQQKITNSLTINFALRLIENFTKKQIKQENQSILPSRDEIILFFRNIIQSNEKLSNENISTIERRLSYLRNKLSSQHKIKSKKLSITNVLEIIKNKLPYAIYPTINDSGPFQFLDNPFKLMLPCYFCDDKIKENFRETKRKSTTNSFISHFRTNYSIPLLYKPLSYYYYEITIQELNQMVISSNEIQFGVELHKIGNLENYFSHIRLCSNGYIESFIGSEYSNITISHGTFGCGVIVDDCSIKVYFISGSCVKELVCNVFIDSIYPSLITGLQGVSINFGQKPFVFHKTFEDIYKNIPKVDNIPPKDDSMNGFESKDQENQFMDDKHPSTIFIGPLNQFNENENHIHDDKNNDNDSGNDDDDDDESESNKPTSRILQSSDSDLDSPSESDAPGAVQHLEITQSEPGRRDLIDIDNDDDGDNDDYDDDDDDVDDDIHYVFGDYNDPLDSDAYNEELKNRMNNYRLIHAYASEDNSDNDSDDSILFSADDEDEIHTEGGVIDITNDSDSDDIHLNNNNSNRLILSDSDLDDMVIDDMEDIDSDSDSDSSDTDSDDLGIMDSDSDSDMFYGFGGGIDMMSDSSDMSDSDSDDDDDDGSSEEDISSHLTRNICQKYSEFSIQDIAKNYSSFKWKGRARPTRNKHLPPWITINKNTQSSLAIYDITIGDTIAVTNDNKSFRFGIVNKISYTKNSVLADFFNSKEWIMVPHLLIVSEMANCDNNNHHSNSFGYENIIKDKSTKKNNKELIDVVIEKKNDHFGNEENLLQKLIEKYECELTQKYCIKLFPLFSSQLKLEDILGNGTHDGLKLFAYLCQENISIPLQDKLDIINTYNVISPNIVPMISKDFQKILDISKNLFLESFFKITDDKSKENNICILFINYVKNAIINLNSQKSQISTTSSKNVTGVQIIESFCSTELLLYSKDDNIKIHHARHDTDVYLDEYKKHKIGQVKGGLHCNVNKIYVSPPSNLIIFPRGKLLPSAINSKEPFNFSFIWGSCMLLLSIFKELNKHQQQQQQQVNDDNSYVNQLKNEILSSFFNNELFLSIINNIDYKNNTSIENSLRNGLDAHLLQLLTYFLQIMNENQIKISEEIELKIQRSLVQLIYYNIISSIYNTESSEIQYISPWSNACFEFYNWNRNFFTVKSNSASYNLISISTKFCIQSFKILENLNDPIQDSLFTCLIGRSFAKPEHRESSHPYHESAQEQINFPGAICIVIAFDQRSLVNRFEIFRERNLRAEIEYDKYCHVSLFSLLCNYYVIFC